MGTGQLIFESQRSPRELWVGIEVAAQSQHDFNVEAGVKTISKTVLSSPLDTCSDNFPYPVVACDLRQTWSKLSTMGNVFVFGSSLEVALKDFGLLLADQHRRN